MDRIKDCKIYILKTIAKHLSDGENVTYSEYNSLIENRYITVYTDDECAIYHKAQIDVKLFTSYIGLLKKNY